jgi:hypothetical protein
MLPNAEVIGSGTGFNISSYHSLQSTVSPAAPAVQDRWSVLMHELNAA